MAVIGDLNSRCSVINDFIDCDYMHDRITDVLSPLCNYVQDDVLRREAVVKLFLPPFGCDSVRPPYVVVDSKLFSMTLSFYFRVIL